MIVPSTVERGGPRSIGLLLASLAVVALAGCATTVSRREVDEQIDLSGYWNDTDSRLVSTSLFRPRRRSLCE